MPISNYLSIFRCSLCQCEQWCSAHRGGGGGGAGVSRGRSASTISDVVSWWKCCRQEDQQCPHTWKVSLETLFIREGFKKIKKLMKKKVLNFIGRKKKWSIMGDGILGKDPNGKVFFLFLFLWNLPEQGFIMICCQEWPPQSDSAQHWPE